MSQIDRSTGLLSSAAIKVPCRVATTAAITLYGVQTIDAVAVGVGDRVLVKNQTNLVENGIYLVQATDWTRAPDFDGTLDVTLGTMVTINAGTTNGASAWQVASSGVLIAGNSAVTFTTALLGVVGATGATGPAGPTGPAGITTLSGPTVIPNGSTATTQISTDNSTLLATTAFVDAATVANATKWAGANKTVSTAAPSGGVDGDIWIVRAV